MKLERKIRTRKVARFSLLTGAFIILVFACTSPNAQSQFDDPFGVRGFDCARLEELGIEKQMNHRSAAILEYCKNGRTEPSQPGRSLVDTAYPRLSSIAAFGSTDINLITTAETHPNVTQDGSAAWGHGNTVVVAYDDSRGRNFNPFSICGVSVSTNGGATFTRLSYLFNTTGNCSGYPSVFYSVRAAKWFIGFFAGRCGGNFGQWESSDGINWSESGCYTSTGSTDVLSTWVDNNPASPYYGRQYAAYNNFSVGGGRIEVVYSTNDGVTFFAPVALTTGFERSVKITGSLGGDGTVFLQGMNEGGGGLGGPRTNIIHRSTNGGVTWDPPITQPGGAFQGPGRSASGYFAGMYATPVSGYWRTMGWGQPGVGPGGVVHYVYASRPGAGGDPGNIFYIRSANNGTTWSTPLQLNTDTTIRGQWQPSLAVNAQGKVFATWFDERNTTNDSLQRYGRASLDNGLTWGTDQPVSDVVFPKPLQPDPGINPTYAGDWHYAAFSNNNYGSVAYDTWTDGRVVINGNPQQDVFFDKVRIGSPVFDFDGDGRTDISIFRPGPGEWWINRSSNGSTFATQFGASTDKITPGDFTGDGKTDIAFWRPSNGFWFILRSEDFSFFAFPFGTANDIPTVADFEGDGIADVAVFRPSEANWYISRSSGGVRIEQFGANGDVPVPADYDGDGRADLAIYRPSLGQWWINHSSNGSTFALQFGAATDKPVQGDYTGDSRADVAFWRPSTGEWYVLRSEDFSFFSFPFGQAGDIPAPGDYDGDGRYDATVFRPPSATWFANRTTAGTLILQFGASGDRPIANAFVP